MKKFIFFFLSVLLLACANKDSESEKTLVMLVGTYTDTGSCGIYSYALNQETCDWILLDSVATPNPSFLTWSETGKTVYAVKEDGTDDAAVVEIAFDKGFFGKNILAQKTHGKAPCYVATNGKWLVSANYGGGSMSVFPIENEHLLACSDRFFGARTGPDLQRQEAPHIHCAVFTPDDEYVMATDFSADRILSFKIEDESLLPYDTIVVTPGTAPRHLVFSADKKQAYVLGELSGAVTAFQYEKGHLTAFQEIQADSLGARGSGDIHLSRDGRFLYASNRLQGDGIAVFSVAEDGSLTHVGYQDTGGHPRNFALTPNDKFLFCACRDAQRIEIYKRDEQTGLLSSTGLSVPVKKPVFVGFVWI